MRRVIKIIALLALVGSLAWLYADPGYEPVVTSLGALGALVGLLVEERVKKSHENIESSDGNDSKQVMNVERSGSAVLGALSGELDIAIGKGQVYEVFYKKRFKRTPHLELKRLNNLTLNYIQIVEQRTDGFKIKSDDYYPLNIKWKAEGELFDQ